MEKAKDLRIDRSAFEVVTLSESDARDREYRAGTIWLTLSGWVNGRYRTSAQRA